MPWYIDAYAIDIDIDACYTRIAFSFMLCALSHSSPCSSVCLWLLPVQAAVVYERMLEAGLEPAPEHHSAVIHALWDSGEVWSQAKAVQLFAQANK